MSRLVDTDLGTVFFDLEANAISLAGFLVEDCNVGLVNRSLTLNDTTLGAQHRVGLSVTLNNVHTSDDEFAVFQNTLNGSALALVLAGDDDNFVLSLDLAHCPFRSLQHFGRQGNDSHKLLVTKFASHRPKNTSADRLFVGVVQQHRCIAVETDQRTVGATYATTGTDHDRFQDLTFLDTTARNSFLDRHFDDVANSRIATMRTTENLNTHNSARTAVVSDIQHCLRLNHRFSPNLN
ncbi:ATPase [Zymobacter palmae]|uniref:ATPase n=1 Tax=Zymobacter palmae TaxID=33074 RepID=A0A348HBV9_9GAMM|nr:ATPase [Zymobacter palmae]